MATRKENLKKLFTDTRSRNVVIITGFLLVIMVVVGLIALRDRIGGSAGVTGSTKISGRGAKRVRSIPGALKPSEEYVKLVQKANIEAAEKAKKTGRSAIPTIVKAQELTEGNIPVMPKGAVKGVPFSSLARGGTTRGLWFNNLVRTSCSPEAIAEAKAAGATVKDLKAAGCTAKQLLAAGYTLAQLKDAGFTASELRAAGFTAAQLRAAGFTAADLRNAGFSACEVKAAGFTAEEMRAAGFTDGELKGAGFTADEIAGSTGLPPGVTEEMLIKMSCDKDGILNARKRGVSAKKVRSLLGTPAVMLTAAGYSWSELQKADFAALELLKAGADCGQLKQAGYSTQDLIETGMCASKLAGLGVSATEIDTATRAITLPAGLSVEDVNRTGCNQAAINKLRNAGTSAGQIRRTAGCDAKLLRDAGYSPRELRIAGYTARDLVNAGISIENIKGAGFTDAQAKAAGLLPGCITTQELQQVGCDPEALSNLRRRGVSAKHIKEFIGCSATAMLQAGYSASDLKKAGYTATELSKAGQSCSQLRQAGASAAELLESGVCNESQLLAAGFSQAEIQAAKDAKLSGGFTAKQLRAMKGSPDALRAARERGLKASDLRRLGGFSPRELRNAGYTAEEMLKAGYTARELLKAGFSEAELRAAGLSVDDIARAKKLPGGLTSRSIRKGCCTSASIANFRKQGVEAFALRDISNCSPRELRNGGYSAEDLLDAGLTVRQLFASGIDCGQLLRGGASAISVFEASVCEPSDLVALGYSATQINAAKAAINLPGDYTVEKLRQMGCVTAAVRDGRSAGINAGYYHRILGCGARTMRLAGFSVADLQSVGYTAREVLSGGYSESDILRGGFSQLQIDNARDKHCVACASSSSLKSGGCSKLSLVDARAAGISAIEIRDINNCSASNLYDAGFDINDLRTAGFVAKTIKNAGASCDQLRESGITAAELLNAGACNSTELKAAGFTDAQIKNAEVGKLSGGYDIDKLVLGGCNADAIKTARGNGVSSGEIRRILGCSAKVMKDAGFFAGELKQSNYSANNLKAAGFSAKDMRIAGYPADEMRNACFSIAELRKAGYTASELAKAGASAEELLAGGFTPKELREAGYTAKELLAAGVSVKELADAGYTTKDLMDAGVTAAQLRAAGIDPEKLDADALKAGGVTAEAMKKAGYSCAQLKTMGYTVADLKKAGCSAKELLAAGFTLQDLKDGGFTAKELLEAGIPLEDLAKVFSVKELKAAGVTAKELLAAGVSLEDLKAGGFTAKELLAAGVPLKDLVKVFTAKELKDAGVSAAELLAAGVKPRDLLNAGFTVQDLKDAGLTAKDLRKAGITAAELLKGGFSEDEIRKAGYTTAQLGDAGILPVTGVPGATGTAADRANQQLEEVYRRQTAQIDAQKFQQQIQKRRQKMQGEAAKMLAAWRAPVTQTYTEGTPVDKEKEKEGKENSTTQVQQAATGIVDERGNVIHKIKAGDIIYAMLDTTINSDETAPILATITHGPLKGGKLIGTMTKPPNAKSVLVTFNTLSLKQLDHSIPLTAYAIDSNTARTALASRVDNHFLLKYGSIIATSFLDGFGQAFLQSGTSISTSGGGATTTVQVDSRTASEAALVGLGKLGQKLGQALTPLQNKPPTVYVYSGTPIGVFFTADMEIK